ncbi:hypothetical protein KOI35_11910 [Actinoplanes bogorensis]|uniref:Uncharacterized protein n=1 Tax=Paractinoplanes bogorensis TaxID=1610840 RepID=A0ABS5YL54_9ACTN|nr:hypothetical protein [Actinoplanes bogorensis]MBU2664197.1 hypothetical protein [Actinoplanes bogorensis]
MTTVHLRLFADAPPARSLEIAAALAEQLARHGEVRVTPEGTYWKIPEYQEFTATLTPAGSPETCAADIRSRQPTGWTTDVWNHGNEGAEFLLAEIRWAWLTCT